MNGSYTILVWSDDELSLEPLRRLPPGIAIAHPRSERATTELRRRFPNLDPANN